MPDRDTATSSISRAAERPSQILDWITQVSHKSWATSAAVGQLVEAFDSLLYLQANFCPLGVDIGPVDATAVLHQHGFATSPPRASSQALRSP